jgi:hypothetical protein
MVPFVTVSSLPPLIAIMVAFSFDIKIEINAKYLGP